MLLFPIILAIVVVNIDCIEIKLGPNTNNGRWNSKHQISLPLAVGGATYVFSISGYNWFIQELESGGNVGAETDKGAFKNYYIKAFQFNINGIQFIYGIDNQKYWSIHEILPTGKMGKEIDKGYWKTNPTIIFPMNVQDNHFVFSLTDYNWLIRKLTANGRLGSQVDKGSWSHKCTLGFPFSMYGGQHIYCLSDVNWFIKKIENNGQMGEETDNGHWSMKHILYFPFKINEKQYFYGLTESQKKWFIQELLPGGKMGSVKTNGEWKKYYTLMFEFSIHGYHYLYGVHEYYWFTQQLFQDPAIPVMKNEHEYCVKTSNTRIKRQPSNGRANPTANGGMNFVEAYLASNRVSNFSETIPITDSDHSILSYTTFVCPPVKPNQRTIFLTIGIEAEIHPNHVGNERERIPDEVYDHLKEMDRENDDDAGHLIADSLGGPGTTYNFAPQSRLLNRRVKVAGSVVDQPGWYDVENSVRNFINKTSGYVRYSIAVLYRNLQNSRRPTEFWLSVRLYNTTGHSTSWERQSAMTTYIFYNVPTEACTNLNHPWWNKL